MSDSDSGSAPQTTPPPKNKKRKAQSQDAPKPTTAPPPAKKAKKKTKKPSSGAYDDLIDVDLGINKAIAHMDSQLLVDHISQKTKRFEPNLSGLEMESRWLSVSNVRCEISDFDKDRTKENLVEFLGKAVGGNKSAATKELQKAPEKNGSPHTLVIAGAGLRAADLVRSLRTLQKPPATIAKLFAKHIKLSEAIESCNKLRISLGVGTPQRIADLLDDGALKLGSLKRIVVDASHVDLKKRGILDMQETQVPLVKLLVRDDIKQILETGAELIFY